MWTSPYLSEQEAAQTRERLDQLWGSAAEAPRDMAALKAKQAATFTLQLLHDLATCDQDGELWADARQKYPGVGSSSCGFWAGEGYKSGRKETAKKLCEAVWGRGYGEQLSSFTKHIFARGHAYEPDGTAGAQAILAADWVRRHPERGPVTDNTVVLCHAGMVRVPDEPHKFFSPDGIALIGPCREDEPDVEHGLTSILPDIARRARRYHEVALIEVKCPVSNRPYTKIAPYQRCQMDWMMGWTGIRTAHLTMWTSKRVVIQTFAFDAEHFDKINAAADEMYWGKLAPLLIAQAQGRLRPGSIVPDDVINAPVRIDDAFSALRAAGIPIGEDGGIMEDEDESDGALPAHDMDGADGFIVQSTPVRAHDDEDDSPIPGVPIIGG